MLDLSSLKQSLIIEQLTGWDSRPGYQRILLLRKWQIIPPNTNWVNSSQMRWFASRVDKINPELRTVAERISIPLIVEYIENHHCEIVTNLSDT